MMLTSTCTRIRHCYSLCRHYLCFGPFTYFCKNHLNMQTYLCMQACSSDMPILGWNSCGAPKVHQVASGVGGRDVVSDLKLPSPRLQSYPSGGGSLMLGVI